MISAKLSIGLACACMIVCAAGVILCRTAIHHQIFLDMVGHRSSHTKATSRAGGVSVLLPWIILLTYSLAMTPVAFPPAWRMLLLITFGILCIGAIDDYHPVPPGVKLAAQGVFSVVLVLHTGPVHTLPLPGLGLVELGILGWGCALLWVLGLINVFNFMDGLNGLLGGCVMVVTAFMALIAGISGAVTTFWALLLLLSALSGFVLLNHGQGKIFLGDAGSLGLGLFFAGLALCWALPETTPTPHNSTKNFLLIPMMFFPLIYDVIVTFLLRALKGEVLHQAHRHHFYQRLHKAGWSHSQVAGLYTLLVLGCCLLTLASLLLDVRYLWLVVVVLFCGCTILARLQFGRAAFNLEYAPQK